MHLRGDEIFVSPPVGVHADSGVQGQISFELEKRIVHSPKGVSAHRKSGAKISRPFPTCHISTVSIAK